VQIDQVAGAVADHLFGRLLRRALIAAAVAAFAIVAVYHFTVAGTLALQMHFGPLEAELIVAAIYSAAALIAAIWWLALGRPATSRAPALSHPRDMQIAMLVEAVMLGYALARKTPRAP